MSDDEETCPLCTEPLDLTDRRTQLCSEKCPTICLWCWNIIQDNAARDGIQPRCPNCRAVYDKKNVKMKDIAEAELIEEDLKKREAKKKQVPAARKMDLADLRVVQRNLVYVVGLSMDVCNEEVLRAHDFFGKYGRIKKISINKNSPYSATRQAQSGAAYVVYHNDADALACIQDIEGRYWNGKQIRACFGTTKYCNAFLRNMPCNNPDCLYLHQLSAENDTFTKEDMQPFEGGRRNYAKLIHPGSSPFKSETGEHARKQARSLSQTPGATTVSERDPLTSHSSAQPGPTPSATWASCALPEAPAKPRWGAALHDPSDGAGVLTDKHRAATAPPKQPLPSAPQDWPSLSDAVDTMGKSGGKGDAPGSGGEGGRPGGVRGTPPRKDARGKPSAADVVAGAVITKGPSQLELSGKAKLMPLASSGKPRAVSKSPPPIELTSSLHDSSKHGTEPLKADAAEANGAADGARPALAADSSQHDSAPSSAASHAGSPSPAASKHAGDRFINGKEAAVHAEASDPGAALWGLKPSQPDRLESKNDSAAASPARPSPPASQGEFKLFGPSSSRFTPSQLLSCAAASPSLPPGFGNAVGQQPQHSNGAIAQPITSSSPWSSTSSTSVPFPPGMPPPGIPPPGIPPPGIQPTGGALPISASQSQSARANTATAHHANGTAVSSAQGKADSLWSDYSKLDQILIGAGLLNGKSGAPVTSLPPGVPPPPGVIPPGHGADTAQKSPSGSRFAFATEDGTASSSDNGRGSAQGWQPLGPSKLSSVDLSGVRPGSQQLPQPPGSQGFGHTRGLGVTPSNGTNGAAASNSACSTGAELPGNMGQQSAQSPGQQYAHFSGKSLGPSVALPASGGELAGPKPNPGMLLLQELRSRQNTVRSAVNNNTLPPGISQPVTSQQRAVDMQMLQALLSSTSKQQQQQHTTRDRMQMSAGYAGAPSSASGPFGSRQSGAQDSMSRLIGGGFENGPQAPWSSSAQSGGLHGAKTPGDFGQGGPVVGGSLAMQGRGGGSDVNSAFEHEQLMATLELTRRQHANDALSRQLQGLQLRQQPLDSRSPANNLQQLLQGHLGAAAGAGSSVSRGAEWNNL